MASASESLRALDGAIKLVFAEEPFEEDWTAELVGDYTDAMAAVRNALPLIADEIEAAEALIEHVRFGGEIDARHPRFVVLARAVALLGENLDANG